MADRSADFESQENFKQCDKILQKFVKESIDLDNELQSPESKRCVQVTMKLRATVKRVRPYVLTYNFVAFIQREKRVRRVRWLCCIPGVSKPKDGINEAVLFSLFTDGSPPSSEAFFRTDSSQ